VATLNAGVEGRGIVVAVPYRSVEDPVRLRRLLQAVFLLQGDLALPDLLRHLVEEATSMTGARYGALGMLDEEGTGLAEFITVGVTPAEEANIAHRPKGLGLLGLLISDPTPLRLADLHAHPDSVGFPEGHPPMTSFLGVPVMARDEVYGNLYLTDKIGWSEFTSDDENLAGALAAAAGIAIQNARLHQRAQDAALLEDRDRIARDLHDAVIQRLFAVGLSLQGVVRKELPDGVDVRLQQAIDDLDGTILQIRSSIFELGAARPTRSVRGDLHALVQDLRPVLGFDVQLSFAGPVDTMVTDEVTEHLLAVAREALTNVARHAVARSARLSLVVADGRCILEVLDDGRGIDPDAPHEPGAGGGLGLGNMAHRAAQLGGVHLVESKPGGGTRVRWQVPLP
jgi:signal transduction histidine kinase